MKQKSITTLLSIGISLFVMSCSNVQRGIAQVEDQEDVNKDLFNSLKENSGNIDAAAIAVEALALSGGMLEKTHEELKDSRMIALMKHTVLSHTLDMVTGSIAIIRNENLTTQEKASIISIPASVLVTVSALRKLGNSSRLAFLSKYRGGVRAAGRKGIMRMPSFLMRMAFLSVGFVITDVMINSLAKKVIDVSIDDAQKLEEALREAKEEAKEEAGLSE